MIYRTNQYKPEQPYQWSFFDRLSLKLVRHPNLFTNLATMSIMIVPWSVIIVISWLVLHLIPFAK